MKLADVSFPVTYEWGQAHALLFSQALAQRLAELHAEYGRPDCVAMPLLLGDGRLMLAADILTATEPGGYLHAMWEAADQQVLGQAVEVIPWADAVAMLPPEPKAA